MTGQKTHQDQLSADQIERLHQFVRRQPSIRDYEKLYPDAARRFPVIVQALPPEVLAPIMSLLDEVEVPETREARLAAHFDLTETEAKICLMLMAGHSLVKVAEIRKVSRNTARNQLQNIYEKTQTRRQAELIRRLHDFFAA